MMTEAVLDGHGWPFSSRARGYPLVKRLDGHLVTHGAEHRARCGSPSEVEAIAAKSTGLSPTRDGTLASAATRATILNLLASAAAHTKLVCQGAAAPDPADVADCEGLLALIATADRNVDAHRRGVRHGSPLQPAGSDSSLLQPASSSGSGRLCDGTMSSARRASFDRTARADTHASAEARPVATIRVASCSTGGTGGKRHSGDDHPQHLSLKRCRPTHGHGSGSDIVSLARAASAHQVGDGGSPLQLRRPSDELPGCGSVKSAPDGDDDGDRMHLPWRRRLEEPVLHPSPAPSDSVCSSGGAGRSNSVIEKEGLLELLAMLQQVRLQQQKQQQQQQQQHPVMGAGEGSAGRADGWPDVGGTRSCFSDGGLTSGVAYSMPAHGNHLPVTSVKLSCLSAGAACDERRRDNDVNGLRIGAFARQANSHGEGVAALAAHPRAAAAADASRQSGKRGGVLVEAQEQAARQGGGLTSAWRDTLGRCDALPRGPTEVVNALSLLQAPDRAPRRDLMAVPRPMAGRTESAFQRHASLQFDTTASRLTSSSLSGSPPLSAHRHPQGASFLSRHTSCETLLQNLNAVAAAAAAAAAAAGQAPAVQTQHAELFCGNRRSFEQPLLQPSAVLQRTLALLQQHQQQQQQQQQLQQPQLGRGPGGCEAAGLETKLLQVHHPFGSDRAPMPAKVLRVAPPPHASDSRQPCCTAGPQYGIVSAFASAAAASQPQRPVGSADRMGTSGSGPALVDHSRPSSVGCGARAGAPPPPLITKFSGNGGCLIAALKQASVERQQPMPPPPPSSADLLEQYRLDGAAETEAVTVQQAQQKYCTVAQKTVAAGQAVAGATSHMVAEAAVPGHRSTCDSGGPAKLRFKASVRALASAPITN